MTRLVARALAIVVSTSACLVLAPVGAGASAPTAQGWWIATNPSALPGVGAPPAAPPSPPDVPADGLLVQGGQDPTVNPDAVALAALIYDIADGETATRLTLAVAPSTATTPGSTLKLCPLVVATIKPAQGGPMSEAPDYDCAKSVSATLGADNTFAFTVAPLVRDSTLAVAVLPTAATDRVVLSKPAASSLAVTGAAVTPSHAPSSAPTTAPSSAAPQPTASGPPAPVDPGTGSGTDPGVGALPAPAIPAEVGTATAPEPVVAGQPTDASAAGSGTELTPASAVASAPAVAHGSGRWPAGAVVAGVVLAVALWTYAGRDAVPLPDDAPVEG